MGTKSREQVLIVVLNFNGFNDTKNAVDSLTKQSYKHLDILVIDNASSKDGNLLETYFSDIGDDRIKLMRNDRNLGFAGGVNMGIRHAINNRYTYTALFNNDAVADKDWLLHLVSAMKKSGASIVTGLLLNEGGDSIDSTAEEYSVWGMPFPRDKGKKRTSSSDSGFVFGASGGASLYKTSLFEDIGLFDESFFAYYEDVDLSFRAQLAGHSVYFTSDAVALHKNGATSRKIPGFTVYQTFKNIPLLFIKNVPAHLFLPVGVRLFVLYILMLGNAIRNRSGAPALKGWIAGIWYFWTRALWLRLAVQSKKRVGASYIKSILWNDLPPDQTGMRKLRKLFTGKS